MDISRLKPQLSDLALIISALAVFGSPLYYFYAFNAWTISLIAVITVSGWLVYKLHLGNTSDKPLKKESKLLDKNHLLVLVYLLIWIASALILWEFSSDRALISPWELIPDYFFFTYFLLSVNLIIIALNNRIAARLKITSVLLHYLLSFSVALIVYKINYGFDPFIHQATLELIDLKGAVYPKPLYYLGNYSIVIFIHKIFGVSIYWLNRLIVPLLAGLLLPYFILTWIKDKYPSLNEKATLLAITSGLVLPYAIFILSTPQNLSYLFLTLLVLSGTKNKVNWILVSMLGLAALFIHPLSGLAGGGLIAFLILDQYRKRLGRKKLKIWQGIIFGGLAISWPLILVAGAGGHFKLEAAKNLLSSLNLSTSFFPNQENFFLNTVYFLAHNYSLLIISLIGGGLFLYYRQIRLGISDKKMLAVFLAMAAILPAYLISRLVGFNQLIDYEQSAYADRLLIIFTIIALPFILSTIIYLSKRLLQTDKLSKIIGLAIIALAITGSLYLAYPRRDNFFNSHGYSVSRDDLEAVKLIETEKSGKYIVLANQQTSAAALKELGFDHYYQTNRGPLYFYPIPTGGPLYQYYLDMVYKKPDRATALKAMDLAGVDEMYLVINKYWLNSRKIAEEAEISADQNYTINAGSVRIFRYLR